MRAAMVLLSCSAAFVRQLKVMRELMVTNISYGSITVWTRSRWITSNHFLEEVQMGLGNDDRKPIGISLSDAYSKIRNWYQSNIQRVASRDDDYGRRSADLIRALPAADA